MTSKTSQKNSEKIDYLIVELVDARSIRRNDVVNLPSLKPKKGLFLGIILKDESMYIAVTSNGKDLCLFNIDTYNITMLEYGNREKKSFIIYTKDIKEQNESVETLGHVLAHFQENGMILEGDDRLVDVSKLRGHDLFNTKCKVVESGTKNAHGLAGALPGYDREVYDEYGSFISNINKCRRNAHDDYDDYISGVRGGTAGHGSNYSREKKFTLFSRKSTRPPKKKMENMINMVKAIFENDGKPFIDLEVDNTEKHDYYNKKEARLVDEDQDSFMSNMLTGNK